MAEKKNKQDLGMDRSGQTNRQRTINKDGSFNMDRLGSSRWGHRQFYHWIITTSWRNYFLIVISFYVTANILFASGYYLIGTDQLNGVTGETPLQKWFSCFFFSAQSFTTVGYGGIHPIGKAANLLAVIEAFFGLMTFAIATGTLFGRFSKPMSKIRYSQNILISPYENGTGLMFICANELRSNLMEVEAQINISWLDKDDQGKPIRKFEQLELEISKISMFATSWVINHPITETSILYKKSYDDLMKMDFEVFVLLKGFDDAFSQTIYSRYSYSSRDLIYGAKFIRPFQYNESGKIILDLNKLGEYEKRELPGN